MRGINYGGNKEANELNGLFENAMLRFFWKPKKNLAQPGPVI